MKGVLLWRIMWHADWPRVLYGWTGILMWSVMLTVWLKWPACPTELPYGCAPTWHPLVQVALWAAIAWLMFLRKIVYSVLYARAVHRIMNEQITGYKLPSAKSVDAGAGKERTE